MAGTVTASIVKNDTTSPPAFQNSAGTEIGTLCRAWVNFNGTTSPGTIRAAFNVSSATQLAAGQYQLNFTNAMPDFNYAVTFGSGGADSGRSAMYLLPTANGSVGTPEGTNKTTTFVQVGGNIGTNPNQALPSMNVAIFR